jgi:uncharacterized membrane-anchored protein
MKKALLIINLAIILVAVNYQIFQKEGTLKSGSTMLLRLVPVDPRSLMQGDYMALRYKIEEEVPSRELDEKGCIVVSLDKNNVASFVRIYKGGELKSGEHLLLYRKRGKIRFGAESFMFQEGDAKLYNDAKYGELKVDESGKSILVGLRGEDFSPLGRR